jgi:hypothetical protein
MRLLTVRMSGNSAERCSVLVAIARNLPELIKDAAPTTFANIRSICPPMRLVSAGPVP